MPHIDKRIPKALFKKIARDPDFIPFDEWFKKFNFARKLRAEKIWIEQNKKCVYCKQELVDEIKHPLQYTLDHINPISNGGSESPSNYQITCGICNGMKGSMPHNVFKLIVYDVASLNAERERKRRVKKEKKDIKEEAIRTGNLNPNQIYLCYTLAIMSKLGIFDLPEMVESIETYIEIVKCESKKKSRAYKRTVLMPKISNAQHAVMCCV